MGAIYDKLNRAPDQITKEALFKKHLKELYEEDIPKNDLLYLIVHGMKLYQKEEYENCIKEILKSENVLSGLNRDSDWMISLVIRLCFKCMKKLNKYDFKLFCSLLISNKKAGNKRTSLTLTNILLKILVEKKMYKYARNYFDGSYDHDGLYNFYKGIIECISMNYENALHCLRIAAVYLDKHQSKIEKYKIITLLLSGRLTCSYPWTHGLTAYKEACEAVKLGDRSKLERVIEEYKNIFWQDGTYFLVTRFHHLILHECIRKISVVYSRIALKEIEKKFKIPKRIFEQFVYENKINGIIQKDIFYSVITKKNVNSVDLLNTASLNERILDNMTYPEIKKINYENYVTEAQKNLK